MRTVIVSVGTSLLINRGWRRGQDLPARADALAALAAADPVQASAETHTLLRLPLRECGTDRLAWLHSDTPEGRWCALTLQAHYAAQGYDGAVHESAGLGYHEATFAERGLRSLLAETFAIIHAAGGTSHVTICATGGFKAEIAYLNLVGLLLGIDVYYLHEQFRELVSLPRLPLDWNMEWVADRAAFFEWIDQEPRPTAVVESRLRAQPDLRPLVADAADGYSYLTPVGDLLYRTHRERARAEPRATWPPPSTRSPNEKNGVSDVEHHRPTGWQHWVRRLTEIDCVESVRVDMAWAGRGGARPLLFAADAAHGALVVVIGEAGTELPLRVETTARGEDQLDLVRTWIERNMRRW